MGIVDATIPLFWKVYFFLSNFFVEDFWYIGWIVVLIVSVWLLIRLSPKL